MSKTTHEGSIAERFAVRLGIVLVFALAGAGAFWVYPVIDASPIHSEDLPAAEFNEQQSLDRLKHDTGSAKGQRAAIGALIGSGCGVAWCLWLVIKDQRNANK
jgi:hypothetical protein